MIKDEHCDLLFGPFGSTLTQTAANATETAGKFLVIWSASADSLYKQGYKYMISATQIAGSLLGQPPVRALKLKRRKRLRMPFPHFFS